MNNTALIARREITTRLQQRGYRIGFVVTILIVIAACVVPSFFSDDDGPKKFDVGIVGKDAISVFSPVGTKNPTFAVHRAGAAEATRKVKDGDWDAAVLPGDRLIVQKSDDGAVAAVQQVYRSLSIAKNLREAGVTGPRATQVLGVPALTVRATESSDNSQREAIGVIAVIALFSQLITFVSWVAIGVVEEKSSRVVELVLSAVRPVQLLAGKLIGIGLLAAAQVLALGVAALVAGTLADTITIPASALGVVLVAFVGFVLGFAFFAALAAAMASTVSRQEEVSGVLTPVTLALTVCYLASFAATSDPEGTFARVLSIVPPVSCIAMPGRIAHGGVPVLDIVAAVVLLALAASAVVLVAARIYRATVLHSGTRVPLRRAWRGEAVADIS